PDGQDLPVPGGALRVRLLGGASRVVPRPALRGGQDRRDRSRSHPAHRRHRRGGARRRRREPGAGACRVGAGAGREGGGARERPARDTPATVARAAPMSNGRTTDLGEIARRAMLAQGLEPTFPAAALAELDTIRGPAGAEPGVRDLRMLPWASIDDDESRDLDQLTVAEEREGGVVRLRVAIADVDALVVRDGPLDGHAHRNTTSVYTAVRIFSMLPERLSTDLTSLAAHADRLAM